MCYKQWQQDIIGGKELEKVKKKYCSQKREILFYKICEVKDWHQIKDLTIQQHISRNKHVRGIQNIDKKKTSQLLLAQNAFTNQEKSSTFYIDLCDILVGFYLNRFVTLFEFTLANNTRYIPLQHIHHKTTHSFINTCDNSNIRITHKNQNCNI
uniref:Uncharacterized protein n=1 Tax=Timema cristinae TaxID=61476 RepID=A0A7R9CNK2_TIMCR|nr:unnamed protein product [Timema cristinae]